MYATPGVLGPENQHMTRPTTTEILWLTHLR